MFVSVAGDDTLGDGLRANPYALIAYAVTNAKGASQVYVCAGTYPQAVFFSAGTPAISIFGGFDCTTWLPSSTAATVVRPAAGTIPLQLQGTSNPLEISSITFQAAGAVGRDAMGNGASSIAAFASSAFNVALDHVQLIAGNATDGTGSVVPVSNFTSVSAQTGTIAPTADGGIDVTDPPPGGTAACADGTSSRGGAGGTSLTFGGSDGAWSPAGTTDGIFDGSQGGTNCAPDAKSGANGLGGTGGVGAASWGVLDVSSANLWTPSSGTAGTNGYPGQGGGGGGAQGAPGAGTFGNG